MLYPTINDLLQNINNRYSLVLATAKRARQIAREVEKREGYYPDKPVIMAIDEINNGKVKIIKKKIGSVSVEDNDKE